MPTERIYLKVDQSSLYMDKRLMLRKGQRTEVLFGLLNNDNTPYNLGSAIVKMNFEKDDGDGLFPSLQELVTESAAQGHVKWVLQSQLDDVPEGDYIGHLRIVNGADITEVNETFFCLVRAGTPE